MTTDQLRRLFLCGECGVAPEWAPISRSERVGAMLSAANRRDLEQALSLVQGVLDRGRAGARYDGTKQRHSGNAGICPDVGSRYRDNNEGTTVSMTIDEFYRDISARLASIGENVSEEKIKTLVDSAVAARLAQNDDLTRKMRFGDANGRPLIGSKFARWGLGLADVEFLYDLMCARRDQGRQGPSEELTRAFGEISEAYYMTAEQVRAIDRSAIDDLFPTRPSATGRNTSAQYGRWTPPKPGSGCSSWARNTWASCGRRHDSRPCCCRPQLIRDDGADSLPPRRGGAA